MKSLEVCSFKIITTPHRFSRKFSPHSAVSHNRLYLHSRDRYSLYASMLHHPCCLQPPISNVNTFHSVTGAVCHQWVTNQPSPLSCCHWSPVWGWIRSQVSDPKQDFCSENIEACVCNLFLFSASPCNVIPPPRGKIL